MCMTMCMSNALICNGSRVLTPHEVGSIRRVIGKPSNRAFFDFMLYTGIRLSEARQLADCPILFDERRQCIIITSGKVKASQKTRNVILCDNAVSAVKEFLKIQKIPGHSTSWQMNLIRWCRAAHITPLPGRKGYNVYGITVRTTRKTWESWLLTTYPDRITHIALSQGHTETTSLRHYLNISFTEEERKQIAEECLGWI